MFIERSISAPHNLPLVAISGTFYRAINPAFRADALSGSRAAGRYSPAGVPTLYMSATPEGVAAAMVAHTGERPPHLQIVELHVSAKNVFDLRDDEALRRAGIQLKHALSPWQSAASAGHEPSSWAVRRRIESLGAAGLIDPSRKAPGLWHLVLFSWNVAGGPTVAVRPPSSERD